MDPTVAAEKPLLNRAGAEFKVREPFWNVGCDSNLGSQGPVAMVDRGGCCLAGGLESSASVDG